MNIDEGLRELARERSDVAPAVLEQGLVREFRKRKLRRKRAVHGWLAIAATVAVVAIWLGSPARIPPPEVRLARIDPPPAVVQAVAKAPVIPPSRPRRRVARPAASEVAGLFYPLPEADTLAPLEYGTVVRVMLPRAALRKVGLAASEERLTESIQADVLIGQDGRARAVRFLE